MADQSPKELSRRDALRILAAAAGAVTLAAIPGKWTKPELEIGVLPAHAQTSGPGKHTVAADPATGLNTCFPMDVHAAISPADAGIPLHYAIVPNPASGGIIQPASPTGTINTDASGVATLTIQVNSQDFVTGDTVTITWSFVNPLDGTGTASQVLTVSNSGC